MVRATFLVNIWPALERMLGRYLGTYGMVGRYHMSFIIFFQPPQPRIPCLEKQGAACLRVLASRSAHAPSRASHRPGRKHARTPL